MLEYIEEVGSTNDVVTDWVRRGCFNGRALYAGTQRAGRGRRGRRWIAPPGEALALSIAVTDPHLEPVMLQVPIAAGVGAARALEACAGVRVQLKWPNDLMIDARKLGGILCEGVFDAQRFCGAVVGIGVNVDTPTEAFPEALRDRAISLLSAGAAIGERGALAEAVRGAVMEQVARLVNGETPAVLEAWRARDVTAGRRVRGEGFEGVVTGVDDQGALLGLEGATTRRVVSGEIHFC